MRTITQVQGKILLALAQFKFLSNSQLYRLGIAKELTWIREKTREMAEGKKPLIGKISFGVHPKVGRLENMYYLTIHGQKVLIEDLGETPETIKIPTGTTLFYKDYTHRKNTIDFHIALSLCCEEESIELLFFDSYFDKIGNEGKAGSVAKNKINIDKEDYIIPDAVFMLEKDQQQQLYLFEMYDGKDTKRTLQQLEKHIQALVLGSPSVKYNFPKAHHIAALFEYESLENAVIERIGYNPQYQNITKFFRLNSLERMKNEKCWKDLHGNYNLLLI